MFCAISGRTPRQPVVTKAGVLFDRSLIESVIDTEGKCPVTGQELSKDELIEVQGNPTVPPRPPSATSVPGMLSLFQNEWDAVMLETFSLKQQLETTRQELSQALYQQDAACRVIARLLKERDEARAALMSARQAAAHGGGGAAAQAPVAPAPASSMEEEEEEEEGDGTTIPASAVRAMETQAKALVKTRKKRALPAGLPEPEALGQWAETGSHSPHSAARGGITTVAADPRRSDVVVTGGVDHKVKVFSRSEARVLSTMGAHTKRINDIAVHWGRNVVVSASLDKTACVWHAAEGGDDFAKAYSLQHGSEVVAACIQATGEYVVTAEKAGSWSFHALADGRTLCTKEGEGDKYRAARVHPDGLLFATATDSGAVRVWDLKAQAQVASFEDHGKGVNALAFSENGYHLATASDDGHLKLWDLRKQRVVKELDMGAPVHCAAFDTSGTYLAAGAADARVVAVKSWDTLCTFTGHSGKVLGAAFAADSSALATTGNDKTLRFYAAQ